MMIPAISHIRPGLAVAVALVDGDTVTGNTDRPLLLLSPSCCWSLVLLATLMKMATKPLGKEDVTHNN